MKKKVIKENSKTSLYEGIADEISDKLTYSLFADLYLLINHRTGLLATMMPNVGGRKIAKFVSELEGNEAYQKNKEVLKSLSSKVGGSSSLKNLYKAVDMLKSKESKSEENQQRIADLKLVLNKIEKIIKSKLTPEEAEVFATMEPLLQAASMNIAKSIEGSIGASTETEKKPEEKPAEEPTEEPTETPAEPAPAEQPKEEPSEEPEAPAEEPAEKPEESPEKEKGKTESFGFDQHLKALIKEMVRKKLGL